MEYVIDCSFTSALFLPDESSKKIDSFFTRLPENDILITPPLWWIETTNVLTVAVRRNRLHHNDIIQIFDLFEKMNIVTKKTTAGPDMINIYNLAQQYRLSAYDAVYLSTALETGATLATLDTNLHKAAREAGLSVV